MPRFSQQFIERLQNSVDLVDFIGKRVELKKAGKEYKACCPFHNEKTPSFYVIPHKGFYHCHGCGKQGRAIQFLVEHDNLPFIDAVKALAREAGVAIADSDYDSPPGARRTQGPSISDQLHALEDATERFQAQLLITEEGKAAIAYLKSRGLSPEIASLLRVGLAPAEGAGLLPNPSSKRSVFQPASLPAAVASGVVVSSESSGRHYERFKNRLIFPIRNRRGEVVAHSGRLLGPQPPDKSIPKYLNTPETELFQKRHTLYGAYESGSLFKNPKEIFVLEGPMDVGAVLVSGLAAVASLGTSFTAQHLKLALSISRTVVFAFDGDSAGLKAAWKAAELAAELVSPEVEFRFCILPRPHDPSSLLQDFGPARVRAELSNQLSFGEFVLSHLKSVAPVTEPDHSASVAQGLVQLATTMPDGVFQSSFIKFIEDKTGIPVESRISSKRAIEVTGTVADAHIRLLISLYAAAPELFIEHLDRLEKVNFPSPEGQLLTWLTSSLRFLQERGSPHSPRSMVEAAIEECRDASLLAGLFLARSLPEFSSVDLQMKKGLMEQALSSTSGFPQPASVPAKQDARSSAAPRATA